MPQDDIKVQAFTADHVGDAVALSQQAGWPHRREDWEMVLSFSKGWVAVDDAGRTVGTAVFTPFGATSGALNMIIVAESLRGRGIGRRLFTTALDAAKGRRLRLTATPDGEPLYRSLGFKPFGRIFQRQGILAAVPAIGGAEDAAAGDKDAVARLDAAAFGEDRSALIDALWQAGRFAVVRENAAVQAFGCLRDFGRGILIGPVVAPSTRMAASLIGHLTARQEGRFLRVDIAADTGLEGQLEDMGLPQTDDGLVMWTEAPTLPPAGAARTMVLANQALG
jgi:predicted N-acetyltransferase YhbS